VQPVPKPSPTFWKAAPFPLCTERVIQPHCPSGVKSRFACTETQYVPAVSSTGEARATSKLPSSSP
jgi:hypothetical protein